MNTRLENANDVDLRFFDQDAVWLLVKDDNNDPFILFVNLDGRVVYVGVPEAMDEEGAEVDQCRGLLSPETAVESAPTFPLVEMGSH